MSKIRKFAIPDILEKREILGENLFIKTTAILQNKNNTYDISKITGVLLDSDEREIFRLLKDESFLRSRITDIISNFDQLQVKPAQDNVITDASSVADMLYDCVATIEVEHCSKITGMILELGEENVKSLLQNRAMLNSAILKAKAAIEIEEKDLIGEEIFMKTENIYPEFAEKITGMIMEIETSKLKVLMKDKDKLQQCIKKAYEALTDEKYMQKWNSEDVH